MILMDNEHIKTGPAVKLPGRAADSIFRPERI